MGYGMWDTAWIDRAVKRAEAEETARGVAIREAEQIARRLPATEQQIRDEMEAAVARRRARGRRR